MLHDPPSVFPPEFFVWERVFGGNEGVSGGAQAGHVTTSPEMRDISYVSDTTRKLLRRDKAATLIVEPHG